MEDMQMDFQKQLGERLRICRVNKKSSIEEIALLSGINPSHLGKIERGESNITLKTLSKIIEALGSSYSEIFNFDKPFQPPKEPLIEKTLSNLYYLTIEEQEHIYQETMLFRSKK
ncbi:MAG: helix-turn-helix transcriptional regulator [Clostridiales bacterium]|nr:helix-turn-helix transcriptional regulator [Clostridiales bacterium]